MSRHNQSINSFSGNSLSRRDMLRNLGLGIGALGLSSSTAGTMAIGKSARTPARRPNFIFILTDDQGYFDLECYGNNNISTPNFNKLADEGIKFTSFYATMVCSPTRATFLTGCNHERIGFSWIVKAYDSWCLNTSEQTIPKMLKQAGYATGCVGKWHIGHGGINQSGCIGAYPKAYGLDYYCGLPLGHYAHLDSPGKEGVRVLWEQTESMSADQLNRVEYDYNTTEGQAYLNNHTIHDTEKAKAFITAHKDEPFFLYMAHAAPHVPYWAPDNFKGTSNWGDYGDVLQSVDWSVGEILKTLSDLGIDDNTFVIFASDNGSDREGSNDPLSGGKWGVGEGSYRVPCLARWPGVIPAGIICDEFISIMDILPTYAAFAGTQQYLPTFKYDGFNQSQVFLDPNSKSSRDELPYYKNRRLEAFRKGDYKVHFSRGDDTAGLHSGDPYLLYNVKDDPAESNNLINDPSYKSIVDEIVAARNEWRTELGDSLTGVGGNSRRSHGNCG
ncbi:MAG: sulfatase-like hydrolase/transferase [Chitinivibrionales bacterium]|nr:sulfatase-like hydrolase/transferase [Chitinivibrionales bacterium]